MQTIHGSKAKGHHHECQTVFCSCHNVCIYGYPYHLSTNSKHIRMLSLFDPSLLIQKLGVGSITLSNCSTVVVRPFGSNSVNELELTCLECKSKFTIYMSSKSSQNIFCQKQVKIEEPSPNIKKSFSSDGSMGSIYSDWIPSPLRLLFDRQNSFYDTYDIFGYPQENCHKSDNDLPEYTGYQKETEDEDYDLMFSNCNQIFVGCFTNLGKYLLADPLA